MIAKGSLDFYDWTSIISEVENLFPVSNLIIVHLFFLLFFLHII